MTCDLACDGEQALQLIGTKPYDAILTDLRMPRRHGYALCVDVMKLPSPPGVMVMTGLSDPRLANNLRSLGVYNVAQKNGDFDALADKVRSMIESGRSRQAAIGTSPRPSVSQEKVGLLHQIEKTLVDLTLLFEERLDGAFDSNEPIASPPKTMGDYIHRHAEDAEKIAGISDLAFKSQNDGRKTERLPCFTIATAAPVNENWERTGEPFKLALRDVSAGGARLLHTRAINSDYLALSWGATQLVAQTIRIGFRVRRCMPCCPFYDIGGQFVMAD